MSFDYNPFRRIQLVEKDGKWCQYCPGCGDVLREAEFTSDTPIADMLLKNQEHVREMHRRDPEDFRGWGVF